MNENKKQTAERRRERRVAHDFQCRFRTSEDWVEGKTTNVSLRGFYVEAPTALTEGVQVPFLLKDPSWSKELEIVGRVVHAQEEIGMGVEITQVKFGHDEAYEWYQKTIQKKVRMEMSEERAGTKSET